MTLQEAKDLAHNFNKDLHLTAKVIRTLPEHIDPAKDGDNGWDLEVVSHEPPPLSGEGWSF